MVSLRKKSRVSQKTRESSNTVNPQKPKSAEELTVPGEIDSEPENCNSKISDPSREFSRAITPDDMGTQGLDDLYGLSESDMNDLGNFFTRRPEGPKIIEEIDRMEEAEIPRLEGHPTQQNVPDNTNDRPIGDSVGGMTEPDKNIAESQWEEGPSSSAIDLTSDDSQHHSIEGTESPNCEENNAFEGYSECCTSNDIEGGQEPVQSVGAGEVESRVYFPR